MKITDDASIGALAVAAFVAETSTISKNSISSPSCAASSTMGTTTSRTAPARAPASHRTVAVAVGRPTFGPRPLERKSSPSRAVTPRSSAVASTGATASAWRSLRRTRARTKPEPSSAIISCAIISTTGAESRVAEETSDTSSGAEETSDTSSGAARHRPRANLDCVHEKSRGRRFAHDAIVAEDGGAGGARASDVRRDDRHASVVRVRVRVHIRAYGLPLESFERARRGDIRRRGESRASELDEVKRRRCPDLGGYGRESPRARREAETGRGVVERGARDAARGRERGPRLRRRAAGAGAGTCAGADLATRP